MVWRCITRGEAADAPANDHEDDTKNADATGEAHATRQAEIDAGAAMYAFRQVARGIGQMEETELLRLVARYLGYQRLGRAIEQLLKKHLRTAIRRGIIVHADGLLSANHRGIGEYSRDELWQVLCSVMRLGKWYDREEVPALLAKHLGFSCETNHVRTTVRSAITSAIRRGVLVRGTGGWICRSRS